MPRLTIDGRETTVPPGATVLDAARQLGIDIPALCFLKDYPAFTSCMVCVVKVDGAERLLPACATAVRDGMRVESDTDEVRAARRLALDLLLSDHLGDCVGPCHSLCPAHMDIPRMIRHLAAGRWREAIATVKERIALPAVLGRICPEMCARGCRRAELDSAISICLLKRFAADADLASSDPYRPECAPASGKRVAVVGAGPAGLAAAYYLRVAGHACDVFDEHPAPGGRLRDGPDPGRLPRDVLDAEIERVRELGATFHPGVRVGTDAAGPSRGIDALTGTLRTAVGSDAVRRCHPETDPSRADVSLADLRARFDAVLVAAGEIGAARAAALGLPHEGRGLRVDRHSLATPLDGVFAAGSAVAPIRHAVRACGAGREASVAISKFLAGRKPAIEGRPYTVHIGRLHDCEKDLMRRDAQPGGRLVPAGGETRGFDETETRRESGRCLSCDCRARHTCGLRQEGRRYGASPAHYRGERRQWERERTHPLVDYEPGKCIACGRCVAIAERLREPLGLAWIGRGFAVRVAVPFSGTVAAGLAAAAIACAEACPTAAIGRRSDAGPRGQGPRGHS